MQDDDRALLREIDGYIADGYQRIKFKIEPGRDLQVVRTVRNHVGPRFLLQVDANGSYRGGDTQSLILLDEFNLAMVEQPLPPDDLEGSKLLAAQMSTPICLDEGIAAAADARHAIEFGAGSIINVKPGRVGGILEAHRVQRECAALSAGCWIGGMLETGVGRHANVVLAADVSCTHPGDVSASRRYFATDLTEPFELIDGRVEVPTEPGAARAPIPEVLKRFTTSVERII
jgi:O-succinylbenzoate synthase